MVPFHIHSDYSLLHSSLKIKDLVNKAKELGYETLGISELDNMFSAIEFYETCKKKRNKTYYRHGRFGRYRG
ncbi:PHP domain-containing protein [Caminibacter pacificus]